MSTTSDTSSSNSLSASEGANKKPLATVEPHYFFEEKWIKKLVEQGNLSAAVNNKRFLFKNVLYAGRPLGDFSSTYNLVVERAYRLEYNDPDVEWLVIPDTLGPEVYEYLGFTHCKARSLWVSFLEHKAELDAQDDPEWTEWSAANQMMVFAFQHLRTIPPPLKRRGVPNLDNWRGIMKPLWVTPEWVNEIIVDEPSWLTLMGIKPKFARILLDPELEVERDYHTLDDLVRQMLGARWYFLEHLNSVARAREGYMAYVRKVEEERRSTGYFNELGRH